MALAQVERAKFTTSNGGSSAKGMQETLHLSEKLPLWKRLREHVRRGWFRLENQWEPVKVNKSVDSVTMPKWIAIGILGAMLTFGIQSWWCTSDQRDMLIELKTVLRLAKEYETERSRQLREQAELNKVHIDNITGELKTIKGMLTAPQLSTLESIKRGNN